MVKFSRILGGFEKTAAFPVTGQVFFQRFLDELSASLQTSLNDHDVDGLLGTVCEDGKVNDAARNDLMNLPFLDPSSSQYSDDVDFPKGSPSEEPDPEDGSYLITFAGSDTSTGEPIQLTFKAYVHPDHSGAVWCGVAG